MIRRPPTVELLPLLGTLGQSDDTLDATTVKILDATAQVLAVDGLRRCTVEEIAERGKIGRTTIYRRFDSRDDIVTAVLSRELRAFLTTIRESVQHLDTVEDRLVAGFQTGLQIARESLLVSLLRSEPDLTSMLLHQSGPLMELALTFLVAELINQIGPVDPEQARHGAEILMRLAMSFALMPETTLPLDDTDACEQTLHNIFDPLLAQLRSSADQQAGMLSGEGAT